MKNDRGTKWALVEFSLENASDWNVCFQTSSGQTQPFERGVEGWAAFRIRLSRTVWQVLIPRIVLNADKTGLSKTEKRGVCPLWCSCWTPLPPWHQQGFGIMFSKVFDLWMAWKGIWDFSPWASRWGMGSLAATLAIKRQGENCIFSFFLKQGQGLPSRGCPVQ